MNFLLSLQIFGRLIVALGFTQLIPALAAEVFFDEDSLPYLLSAASCFFFGVPLILASRNSDRRIRPRDGFVVVGIGWILASIFGSVPYILAGNMPVVDSLFESAAGFTTTGSSVMSGLDTTAHSLLLWRSMTQWMGGMGIIVFAVAVLPFLGIGGMQLFKAEVPGPVADKLTPRIAETARRLWIIYLGLTGLAIVTYFALGMSFFEATCHAFTTIATGGFSTRDASLGGFGAPNIEWAASVFMLLSGMNFVLHYRVVTGRIRDIYRDAELLLFLSLILFAIFSITWVLEDFSSLSWDSARYATFHVISLMTTTGYTATNFALWPGFATLILLQVMVVGGMAGSTSGGVKVIRVLLGFRLIQTALRRFTHPHSICNVKYAGKAVPQDVIEGVGVFFAAYILLAAICSGIVATGGYDVLTSATAAISTLSNIGPGLGRIGPTENFAHFPGYIKITLSFAMIAGRLELFTILALLQPSFWRR